MVPPWQGGEQEVGWAAQGHRPSSLMSECIDFLPWVPVMHNLTGLEGISPALQEPHRLCGQRLHGKPGIPT